MTNEVWPRGFPLEEIQNKYVSFVLYNSWSILDLFNPFWVPRKSIDAPMNSSAELLYTALYKFFLIYRMKVKAYISSFV